MHRILPVVLFAMAALGAAACENMQTGAAPAGAASASSEASAAALDYDPPDNTDMSEE